MIGSTQLSQVSLSLATVGENPSFSEVITFALTGFAVVLVTLTLLAVITSLIGLVFKRLARKAEQPAIISAPAAAAVAAPVAETVDPKLVAVIAAAVATSVSEPHRIVSIRPPRGDWSREGRRAHFDSHKVR